MLPALRNSLISRISPFNAIPPIGAPIYNFQNHDGKVWLTLQNIKEIEKTVSQETAVSLPSSTKEELNLSFCDQHSNFQQKEAKNKDEEDNKCDQQEKKMDEEKCVEDVWQPWSSSDSELEFSVHISSRPVPIRYSTSDQESLSDSEL